MEINSDLVKTLSNFSIVLQSAHNYTPLKTMIIATLKLSLETQEIKLVRIDFVEESAIRPLRSYIVFTLRKA